MERPRISIITPVLNGEKTIARTIESVLHQTYKPFEYIVVDGKSSDATIEIAKRYESQFMERGICYRILSEQDEGIYDAMNKGIMMCDGELVGIINSDDWYETIALEEVKRFYTINPCDLVYADLRIHIGERSFVKKAKKLRIASSRYWNHPTQFVNYEIYRKKIYDNQSIYGDLDMLLWVRKNGYRIKYINTVLANFTMGGKSNSANNLNAVMKNINSKLKIYLKNGYSIMYFFDVAAIEITKFMMRSYGT